MRKTLIVIATSLVGAFLLMQLVPYRVHNPNTRREPNWDSPRTRALAVAACYDCHSNEVQTPWYGKIAPVSWLITNHVDEGRAALNFSDWNSGRDGRSDDLLEVVRDGSMPPSYFTWFGLHSNAKLSAAERDELIRGLRQTMNR
jgi:Haem-binding domain